MLAPGGRILIEEPLRVSSGDVEHPSFDMARRNFDHFVDYAKRTSGFDLMLGGKLPRMMVDAGLDDVQADLAMPLPRGGDLLCQWYDSSARAMATKVDINPYFVDVDHFFTITADATFFFVQWALVSCSGRKAA